MSGLALSGRPPAPRLPGLALLVALALAALGAPAARADVFGPISLVSEGALGNGLVLQAEYAHDAAISGNGQYVAFDGSVGGATGVWRRDLATGEVEQVAGGDAELPSISESGQLVSFTTNEGASLPAITYGPRHEPPGEQAGTQEAVNVYVRNMSLAPQQEGAFVVASAPSGSAEPLAYSGAGTTQGSTALGRSAISADGQEVAFVTTAVSDLGEGTATEPQTPALQVAVRYLQSEQTVLVSGAYEPLSGETTGRAVPSGAVYQGPLPPEFEAPPNNGEWGKHYPPGASLSADGSTVAWMARNVDEQARMLPGETPSGEYTEPLWRRIAPGSQTSTERVTGGSEPANPACIASGESSLPPAEGQLASDPCQGPFRVDLTGSQGASGGIHSENDGGEGNFVPRLSGDGYTVAFISSAVPVALGNGYGLEPNGEPPDLYIADMRPGLTRRQALTPLTQIAGTNVAAGDSITDFDISPNGAQVAFTTRRIEFPLGEPAYVSAPAAEPGLSELFDVDLRNDTLTRVTHGYEGGPSAEPGADLTTGSEDIYGDDVTEGAQSPSFSDGGELLAFSSTAANLVYGDGNAPAIGPLAGPLDGSDAFLVHQEAIPSEPTPELISPAPEPAIAPSWRLGLTARSRANGGVLLYVAAPAAGALRAGASGSVLVKVAAGAGGGKHRGSKRRARETVATRTLATATASIHAGEAVREVALTLAKRYAPLASRSGGQSASVTVTFQAPGHATLRATIEVRFHRTQAARAGSKKKRLAGARNKQVKR